MYIYVCVQQKRAGAYEICEIVNDKLSMRIANLCTIFATQTSPYCKTVRSVGLDKRVRFGGSGVSVSNLLIDITISSFCVAN